MYSPRPSNPLVLDPEIGSIFASPESTSISSRYPTLKTRLANQSIHHQQKPENEETPPSIFQKCLALNRIWSYRRPAGKAAYFLGSTKSYGMMAVILLSTIVLTAMVFAQRPYYRLPRGYGSPALGIRAGLMALALTPLIYALSGKVNIITILSGGALSHERLNVLHRYTSYLCLGLAIVHIVPLIVAPLQDSKGGYALLKSQFARQGLEAATEYSGIAPFAVLFFLRAFSIPLFRKNLYEIFVQAHILAAIFYLGLMFWHVGTELDSRRYMGATLGIWVFNIVARLLDRQRTEIDRERRIGRGIGHWWRSWMRAC